MKNRSRQRRIRQPHRKNLRKIFRRFRPARCNHWHRNLPRNRRRQRHIESAFCPILIHRRQQNLSRTRRHSAPGPLQRIQPRRIPSASNTHIPMFSLALRIDCQHHCLRPKFLRQFRNQFRPLHRRRIHSHFVRASFHHCPRIVQRSNPSARRQRNRQPFRHSPNRLQKCRPPVARRRNIQHHQFVRTLRVIPRRQLGRVTRVTQSHKIHTLHYACAVHIQAGNNPPRQPHAAILKKFPSSFAPEFPLFSG